MHRPTDGSTHVASQPGSPALVALTGAVLTVLALTGALAREGVRVDTWHPPAAAPWALAAWASLVWLASGRARRDTTHPGRWSLAALAAFSAWVALETWPGQRAGGDGRLAALVTRVTPAGDGPIALDLALAELASPPRLAERVGRRDELAVVAAGVVTLLDGGRQRLGLTCQGTCVVHVGGRPLLRAAGAPARAEAELALPAGSHALRLELTQPSGRARLALDWDGPARLDWLPLDARVAPAPIDPGRLRRREHAVEARVVLRTLVTALGWLALLRLLPWAWRALRRGARAWWSERLHREALLAGVLAAAALAALRAWAAPHVLPGGYLHAWSSEYMMQTVSLADLRLEPLRSLVYLHIQPPLLDALRALLVALHPALEGAELVRAVDADLYRCWGLAYGAAVALVFTWIARRWGRAAGALSAALFALHPAVIFYATFLDTTFVSALGVLALGYELWRAADGHGSAGRLAAVLIALLLTRSIVQWPFAFVMAASLALVGAGRGVASRALLAFGLVTALFVAKQYALFGLTISSSFGPDSFCKGLSEYCLGTTPVPLPSLPSPAEAWVLRRTEKLNGEYNYNQLAFLRRSFAQLAEYRALLRAAPPGRLARLLAHNVSIWLKPSTHHSSHVLVDRLPWREPFDRVFSGAPLAALLAAAAGAWAWRARVSRRELLAGLGLALPLAYVAAVSIVFESGENMRYKFFVEPLLCVLLLHAACDLAARLRGRAREARS